MKRSEKDRFAETAYRLLIVERRQPTRAVADKLDLKYATFHARLGGRIPFRPAEIAALLREVPDLRLAEALLAGTPFRAVRRTRVTALKSDARILGNPADACDRVAAAFMDLQAELRNKPYDEWDLDSVRNLIESARKTIDTLAMALPEKEPV